MCVLGFILLIPAFMVMHRSCTCRALFESAAVEMLVPAGNDLIGLEAARVEAQVIGVTLLAEAAVGIACGVRHVSSSDVSKKAIASQERPRCEGGRAAAPARRA